MAEELGRAITIRLPSWLSMETASTVLGTVGGTLATSYSLQRVADYLNVAGWKKVGLAYLIGGIVSLVGYIGVQKVANPILRHLSFGGIIGGLVTPLSLTIMQAVKAVRKKEGMIEKILAGIAGEPIASAGAQPVYVVPATEPISQEVEEKVVVAKPPEEEGKEESRPVLTATIE